MRNGLGHFISHLVQMWRHLHTIQSATAMASVFINGRGLSADLVDHFLMQGVCCPAYF